MFEDNLRRRTLYPTELLAHIGACSNGYRHILLRKFIDVKKNRHIFHAQWNILSNSFSERRLRKMYSLQAEMGDLDDMIFDEYDGGPSER